MQQSYFQINANKDNATVTLTMTGPSKGWAGCHVGKQFFGSMQDMRDLILLDNQSTTTVFCNKQMVSNIQDTTQQLRLHTNGGVLKTSQKATVLGWGTVWFSLSSMTNIFGSF